jgi:cell division protein FtsQ
MRRGRTADGAGGPVADGDTIGPADVDGAGPADVDGVGGAAAEFGAGGTAAEFGAGGTAAAAARARADPWRVAFFGLLAAGVVAAAGWAVFGHSLLVVRHVVVTGANRLVPAAAVRQAAAIRLGTPLAEVDTEAIAHRVEGIAPVALAHVSRSWPDTIVIAVTDRVAALAVADTGKYELIDADGVTVRLSVHKPKGMPLLKSPPPVLRGDPAIRAAVAVLAELPAALRGQVSSVSAPGAESVTLHLSDGITIRWGGTGQASRKAAELALLLRKHARYYDVSDPATAVTQG